MHAPTPVNFVTVDRKLRVCLRLRDAQLAWSHRGPFLVLRNEETAGEGEHLSQLVPKVLDQWPFISGGQYARAQNLALKTPSHLDAYTGIQPLRPISTD